MDLLKDVPALLAAGGGLLVGLTPTITAFFQNNGKRMDNKLELRRIDVAKEDALLTNLTEQLKRVEARAELLNTKVNEQAVLLAEVQGELRYLRMSEVTQKAENERLLNENKRLTLLNERLNDENEAQGARLAQLQGRLDVLDPGHKGGDVTI